MRRILIIVVAVVISMFNGCTITTIFGTIKDTKNISVNVEERIIEILKEEGYSAEVVSVSYSTNGGSSDFIKAHIKLNGVSSEAYYNLKLDKVCSYLNYSEVVSNLYNFVLATCEVDSPLDGYAWLSPTSFGKRVLYTCDKDLESVINSGNYSASVTLAYLGNDYKFSKEDFYPFFHLFKSATANIYVYEKYPDQNEMYKGTPDFSFTNN